MRPPKHELTEDLVVRKILELLKEEGKTAKELEQSLGLKAGAMARWKYLNSKSYMKYINEIALFLNTTSDYLLNDTEVGITVENMTQSELRLLRIFRNLTSDKKKFLILTAEMISDH